MKEVFLTRARSSRTRSALIGAGALVIALSSSAVAVAASLSPHSLSGAGRTYAVITGINGEGTSPQGSIDIMSWSWGLSQQGSSAGTGLGAGKVTFNPFSITRKMDKASPLLFQACAGRTVLPKLTLTVSPPDSGGTTPGDLLVVTLTNAYCLSLHDGFNQGDDAPTESFSLNFSKITYDYYPQSGATAVHGGWDVKANKKA